MDPIRVLVVDDYEPFRRLIRSMIQSSRSMIIGEASDGPEAVHKAALLQPDLILLDIALPKLNGVRTAEQIREVAPSSKILFLTQNDSPDVIQAALSTGALGYVHKNHLHQDLTRAIEAVLAGKRFVGWDPDIL
jgi:two-component system, NarL family, response regulator LiaR